MNPADSIVERIEVNYENDYIGGFKILAKDGSCVLEAGVQNKPNKQTVVFKEGERLLGIRSKRYSKSGGDASTHCNMVFIIGRME